MPSPKATSLQPFQSKQALLEARALLASRGIPNRIDKQRDSFALQLFHERQTADALALLQDSNHVVAETLSDEELSAARVISAKEQQASILRMAWQLGQITSLGLLLALLVFWLLK